MDFNSLFFPAPREKYTCVTHFGEMIYLPKSVQKRDDGTSIANIATETYPKVPEDKVIYVPCLLIQHKQITSFSKPTSNL